MRIPIKLASAPGHAEGGSHSRNSVDLITPQGCNAFEWIGCGAAIAGCAALNGPALIACVAAAAPGCVKCVS